MDISDDIYHHLSNLVYSKTRIYLGKEKKYLLKSRLRKRLISLKLPSFESYWELLQRDLAGKKEEVSHLIDFITTNYTKFFRERLTYEFIRDKLIPERKKSGSDPLHVWSAACSTGEEAYSVAMLLHEIHGNHGKNMWTVSASDVSEKALRRAREAVYLAKDAHMLEPSMSQQYFVPMSGDLSHCVKVSKELRDKIHFSNINLFQPHLPFNHQMGLIMCKNVMIYFDRKSRSFLVDRMHNLLEPGGHLIVGASESLMGMTNKFEQVEATIYRKK